MSDGDLWGEVYILLIHAPPCMPVSRKCRQQRERAVRQWAEACGDKDASACCFSQTSANGAQDRRHGLAREIPLLGGLMLCNCPTEKLLPRRTRRWFLSPCRGRKRARRVLARVVDGRPQLGQVERVHGIVTVRRGITNLPTYVA